MQTSAMPVIELSGPPRQRGRIHGEALGGKIRESLGLWERHIGRKWGVTLDAYLEQYRRHTHFEKALTAHAPHLPEEVAGIAEASGADYQTLLAFQEGNEHLWVESRISGKLCPGAHPDRCSTIAVCGQPGLPNLICHNVDWISWQDGYQVLFKIRGGRREDDILAFSVAGQVNINGINRRGLAVADNALPQLGSNPGGLPVYAVYRRILEMQTFAEAEAFLQRTPHASGINWVLGSHEKTGMYETSAHKVVPFRLFGQFRRLYHTNHPFVNDDQKDFLASDDFTLYRSTYLRHAALHRVLGDFTMPLTVDLAKKALSSRHDSDYPVSRGDLAEDQSDQIGFTLASVIFELEQGAPKMHIAAGPPHKTEYQTFTFD